MRIIIPGITHLTQYLNILKDAIETLRPESCIHCGELNPQHHGHYDRKADRGGQSLNPIPILRFYCAECNRTCSVLPECIPPRRWYVWQIQQLALLMSLAGQTAYALAQQVEPRSGTLRRWLSELKKRHQEFQAYLKSRFSTLGYYPEFQTFWQQVLQLIPLSHVMFYLNTDGVIVP